MSVQRIWADFNSIEEDEILCPNEAQFEPKVGERVALIDGEHRCEGTVTEVRGDKLMVMPDWSTWETDESYLGGSVMDYLMRRAQANRPMEWKAPRERKHYA